MIIVQVAGRLGADPETRFTPSGQKVVSMRVAADIRRGGKKKTIWWKVTIWGDHLDRRVAHLKKGSAVIVMGEMGMPDIYNDREGNPQTSFEIVADYIGFNPFGDKDRNAQDQEEQEGRQDGEQRGREGDQEQQPESRHAKQGPAGFGLYGAPKAPAFGNAKAPAFGNESAAMPARYATKGHATQTAGGEMSQAGMDDDLPF